MTKRRVPRFILFDLTYVVPTCLFALTIWSLYSTIAAGYAFPPGGLALGWLLSLLSVVPIVYALCRYGVAGLRCATCPLVVLLKGDKRRRPPPPPRLPKELTTLEAVVTDVTTKPASPAMQAPSSPVIAEVQKTSARLRPDCEIEAVAVV